MKLTKSKLKQLIQEEIQAVLSEQTDTELDYLSALTLDATPEELNLLSLGMDPNLARPRPKTAPPIQWKPEGYRSATMEPGWRKALRAHEEQEALRDQATVKDLLDPGAEELPLKRVERSQQRGEMERGSR